MKKEKQDLFEKTQSFSAKLNISGKEHLFNFNCQSSKNYVTTYIFEV